MVVARWARQPVMTMSAAICLTRAAEHGNHVWREVDGNVPGDFDHEPRPFIEES
jgi:hypothetical protein